MKNQNKKSAAHYKDLPPTLESLVTILRCLRAPDGCPWDRKQTRETLIRCLVEECAELVDAIDGNDIANIKEELGDVLMNIVLQTLVAEEREEFTLEDVIAQVNHKMVSRHAHIFGDAEATSSEEALEVWNKMKLKEKGHERKSIIDGIPSSLSALSRAEKMQNKVSKVGFDWICEADVFAKIEEEMIELKEAMLSGDDKAIDDELGDLLFTAANLARFRKRRTSEELLRASTAKFSARFRFIEASLEQEGLTFDDASLDQLERLWQKAKSVLE